jgi:hypothetical protein
MVVLFIPFQQVNSKNVGAWIFSQQIKTYTCEFNDFLLNKVYPQCDKP